MIAFPDDVVDVCLKVHDRTGDAVPQAAGFPQVLAISSGSPIADLYPLLYQLLRLPPKIGANTEGESTT